MIRNLFVSLALAAFVARSAPAQDPVAANAEAQRQRVAEIARAMKAKKKPEVVVDQADAEKLFGEVDSILQFASQSSELPKKNAVKYKLLGRDEVDKRFADALSTDEATKR